jgi:MFS family permease
MAQPHIDETIVTPPTRARFVLALWLCGLSTILYLDRICMSQAVEPIQLEFKLSNTEMSYVMMAFTLAYGLFEVPSGRMGDRYGSRSVLTRIVIWWSVSTALTGAVTGFVTLLLVRFLFGVGEAGALPNATRVIARWYPLHERGRIQGVMLSFAQFGAVIAPVGAAFLIGQLGWRWSFSVFALLGVVWAVGFWRWFRDDPAEHPSVNAAELNIIQNNRPIATLVHTPIPWRAVRTNRGIIVLSGIMICSAFFTYFFYSWFPKYLTNARNFSNHEAGRIASLVLAGSAAGTLLGGWLADRVPRWSSNPLAARRYLSVTCYLVAALCLYLGIHSDNPITLTAMCGASIFAMHVTLPNWWSVAIPQCGRHIGSLSGLMNGCGAIGAILSQWFVGIYSDSRAAEGYSGRAQWDPMFDIYVGILLLAGVAWWSYRLRPLEEVTARIGAEPRG